MPGEWWYTQVMIYDVCFRLNVSNHHPDGLVPL